MAKKYKVGLKEHNGDYLDDVSLLMHIPSQITATNVRHLNMVLRNESLFKTSRSRKRFRK